MIHTKPKVDMLNADNVMKIDLLSETRVISKQFPNIHRVKSYWKKLSGNLKKKSSICIGHFQSSERTGENYCIVGSPSWSDFTLQVKFKLLTESIKPPEGGSILYFHFKNGRNFYSFHFCLCKQRIEFIKRFRGKWSVEETCCYGLEIAKEYDIVITSSSGSHRCKIDNEIVIENFDSDIFKGYIGMGTKYCDTEFSHVSVLFPFGNPNIQGKWGRFFL